MWIVWINTIRRITRAQLNDGMQSKVYNYCPRNRPQVSNRRCHWKLRGILWAHDYVVSRSHIMEWGLLTCSIWWKIVAMVAWDFKAHNHRMQWCPCTARFWHYVLFSRSRFGLSANPSFRFHLTGLRNVADPQVGWMDGAIREVHHCFQLIHGIALTSMCTKQDLYTPIRV